MSIAHLDYPAEKLAPFGRGKIEMEVSNEIEASMRLVACSKEPWTVAVIESLAPEEVFWDIGANVGSYTLLAAARNLAVVAFEPVSENYGTLCRNLALNNLLDQVLALCIGLGPGDGLAWMHRSDMRSGAASHLVTEDPKKVSFHKQLIPVLGGDTAARYFKLPLPHAIKLDVDGTEREVLQGMEGILASEQLRILLIEMHTEWDGALTVWLKERGWIVEEQFDPRGPIYYARFGRAVKQPIGVTPTVVGNQA